MSTIEDFENAPVGATATSPDGRQVYRREAEALVGADWVCGEGDTRLWADADGLAHFGYTLGPAPSPAPTNSQEALDLAWNLGHEVKEGQAIPEGVRLLDRSGSGRNDFSAYATRADIIINARESLTIRTLDPLPEPEPDWLDAPAVLATMNECSWQKVWLPSTPGHWECTCCGVARHWSKMTDVTPLYPKGQEA